MQSDDRLNFPLYLLVVSPLLPGCVALVAVLASALGKSIAVFTPLGTTILILLGITGFVAFVAELYAVPVALKVLAGQPSARTARNIASAFFGAAFFFGTLYWLLSLRHG